MKRIVIGIETKTREFLSKTLLAACLCERGFEVIMVEAWSTSAREIYELGALAYFDRNTFSGNREKFSWLISKGVNVFCLDEEGAVWFHKFLYLNRMSRSSCAHTDIFFTWGSRHSRLSSIRVPQSRIRETGNPRFDLMRYPLRKMYDDEVGKIERRHSPFILVASNFSLQHRFGYSEIESARHASIKELKKRKLLRTRREAFYFENLCKHREAVLRELKTLIAEIATKFPGKTVVIRPHPSENPEPWKQNFAGHGNIHVIFEGDLQPWIMAADAVIHNSCTSGVEAFFIGTPSFAFMPFSGEDYEAELPAAASRQVNSIGEMVDELRRPQMRAHDSKIVAEYISYDMNHWNAEKIAVEIVNGLRQRGVSKRFRASLFFMAYRGIRKLKELGKKAIWIGYDADIRSGERNAKDRERSNKMPGLETEDVRQALRNLQRVSGRFDGVRAKNVAGKIVLSKSAG